MGSDMHMSPPTPDESRLVRRGDDTAIYKRHTDGIYGDTSTWRRTFLKPDTEGIAFDAIKETTNMKTVTLDIFDDLSPTLPMYALATSDRDWEAEEAELVSKVHRAEEKAARVFEDVVSAKMALGRFQIERDLEREGK